MDDADVMAMLAGLGGLIILIAGWLIAHQNACSKRWERLMREHGAIQERLGMNRNDDR